MTDTLEDAIILACTAHRQQVDKAGAPYILHPLRVMLGVSGNERRIAAVLHDVVEDSGIDPAVIAARFGDDVAQAVVAFALAALFAWWDRGSAVVRVTPNRGRDIAPKLVGFADVHDRYEYVLHLHSKRSRHADFLSPWRTYLYETLLGSAQGPRMGSFIALYGVGNTRKLIAEALD